MKTHRCNQLLEYNKHTHKPCSIQLKKWFTMIPQEKPKWILGALETDLEWDNSYMWNVAEIDFCPFCGKKLIESE